MLCGTLLTQNEFPKLKISIMFSVNTFSLSESPYPITPKMFGQNNAINAKHSEMMPMVVRDNLFISNIKFM